MSQYIPLDRFAERIVNDVEYRKDMEQLRRDEQSLAQQMDKALEQIPTADLVRLMMHPRFQPAKPARDAKGKAWLSPNGKVEYRP